MNEYPQWHPNDELHYSDADDPFAIYCPACGGTGVDDPNFDGRDDEGYTPCWLCHGEGLLYNDEQN